MRRIGIAMMMMMCTVAILAAPMDARAQLFLPSVEYGTGAQPSSVATGDLNEDGKLDAVVANHATHSVTVLLGNGDGTFLPGVDCSPGVGPHGVALARLDTDSHLDMAVACYDGYVSVFLGNGDGTFQTHVEYGAGSGPVATCAEDFDGDGDQDLVVVNIVGNSVSVFNSPDTSAHLRP